MARGSTVPPNIVASTDVNDSPSLELVMFGPAPVGKKVRVTAYVEQLFRHGPLASLHTKAFSPFNGFGSPPNVIDELADPTSLIDDGENGVLLTMTLEVSEPTPPEAAAANRKWSFQPPSDVKTCQPKTVLTNIALGFRAVFNDIDFNPESVIRIPATRFSKNLRLYLVLSDAESNVILYSNGWHTPERIGQNLQGRPTLVSATAPQGRRAPLIGGSGLGPGGPPAEPSASVTDDVTGLYEAFTDSKQKVGKDVPCLLFQLNQAGHAVAGWFARPETNIASQKLPHLRIDVPALPPGLAGVEQGVLLGQFNGEFRLNWGETSDTFVDPVVDEMDAEHTGSIRVIESQNPPSELEAKNLVLVLRRNGAETELFLQQTEPTPRWSNKTIAELRSRSLGLGADRLMRESLRGTQVQPAPIAFWNALFKDLTEEGTLGKLIIRERTSSGSDKRAVRIQINNYLQDLMGTGDRYRTAMVAHFVASASGIEIKVGDDVLTTLDWLIRIQKDFLDDVERTARSRGNPLTAPQLLQRADIGFHDLGLVPLHAFKYELKFTNVGGSIPFGGAVSVGAYMAVLEIKRFRFLEDGTPEIDTEFGDQGTATRIAWFGDAGIGIKAQWNASLKASRATAAPSTITIHTVHEVPEEAFDGAWFYTITGTVASLALSSVFSVRGPRSVVMVLSVNRGGTPIQLVGGADSWFAGPSVTNQPFKKHSTSVSLTVASLSLGGGWITSEDRPAPKKPQKDEVEPEERLADVHTEVQGFFRVNSATLEGRSLAAVEEAFAIDKAMFVSGGGFASCIGHASPEGPDNQFLSEKRADAVQIAMGRAFGKQLALDPVEIIGRGSSLAEAEGMIKPPVPAGKEKEYHNQYVHQFKEYRFVLLNVNGVLLLRMRAGQAGPS